MARVLTKAKKKPAEPAPAEVFQDAAVKYLKAVGGAAVVVGRIGVMRLPNEPSSNFMLCIKITGRMPKAPPNG